MARSLLRRRPFEVERFEYVPVGEELSLLRLSGRWRSDASPRGVRLIAATRAGREQLSPLPEPPATGSADGDWRRAFSASTSLLERGAAFSLETTDGRAVSLPAPVNRETVRTLASTPARDGRSAAAAERALEEERTRSARVEAGLREQLELAVNELADFMARLEGYEARRAELEKELSWERLLHREMRRLAAEAERARDEALAHRERTEADLERVRREAQGRAAALQKAQRRLARSAEETERQRRVREEVEAHARQEIDLLRRELDHLRETSAHELANESARASSFAEDLSTVRERVMALELELEGAHERADRAKRRIAAMEAELERARADAETRAVALEKVQRRLARSGEELKEERRARAAAESHAREEIERVRHELDELRESSARQLDEGSARAESLEEALHGARERVAALEEGLDRAGARAAAAERLLAERDGLLGRARAAAEGGSAQLVDLEERAERLRDRARAGADAERRRRELIERVRGETDRGLAQLTTLEGRIVELRDALRPRVAAGHGDPSPRRAAGALFRRLR